MSKMFWSASANDGRGGFYSEDFHGARRIAVIDSEAQAEAMEAAKALDWAEAEAFDYGEMDEAEIAAQRALFDRHSRIVARVPIMKTIDNPDCMIPADAVEIAASTHAALLAAQAEGLVITSNVDGYPEVEPRMFTADEMIARARARRDQLLKASDWTQMPDAPLKAARKALWKDFRQTLRDLPARLEADAKAGPLGQDLDALIPAEPG